MTRKETDSMNEEKKLLLYHLDNRALKAAIIRNGMTQEQLAEMIGLAPNSISRKINGKNEFTLGEAQKIKEALSLSSEEVSSIFFAKRVGK